MPCNDCPELIPNPNEGCLKPVNADCITFNGEDIVCANVVSGQNLNQVIEQLASKDCDLQDQIDDIKQDILEVKNDIHNFTCEDLSGCSINSLLDVETSAISGDILVFDGVNWVNQELIFPEEFNCSSLSGCTLDNLGNVLEINSLSGDVLVYNGTNWINSQFTANNGLTKNSILNIELGGLLIKNTTILGGNYDLIFGTNTSIIDNLKAYTDTLNIRTRLISLNESDVNTQTQGFRYDMDLKSISIGTDVFSNFNSDNVFRIGDNITLTNTNIFLQSQGVFFGKNIVINSSAAYVLGSDIDISETIGVIIGDNINSSNLGGAFLIGTNIDYVAGGTGNQSLYVFGSEVEVTHNASVNQGNLVFNPTAVNIISSNTGSLNINDKIRVGEINKVWTTFNSSGYYLFTDLTDSSGWNTSTNVVKIMKDFIKIAESSGSVSEEEKGCIRYNGATDKFQGYTTTGWVDLH